MPPMARASCPLTTPIPVEPTLILIMSINVSHSGFHWMLIFGRELVWVVIYCRVTFDIR